MTTPSAAKWSKLSATEDGSSHLVYSRLAELWGQGGVRTKLEDTITCPKCGFTGSFSVHIG